MQSIKPLIIESMKRVKPTQILDLGCGKRKFSQIFIEKGIEVIGVDKEPVAESKDNFTFIQENILDYKFDKKFDLIFATAVLHFIKREEACNLIKKMQNNTVQNGFHFFICMSNKEKPNNEIYFYPDKEELNKLYSRWEIIHNTSCLSKKHG